MKRLIILTAGILFAFLSFAQTPNKKISGDLIIFHAGSLTVPVRELSQEFNKLYPDVKILSEAAGSVASARKITDLNRPCDVMMSADYGVIDKMLVPKFSDWNIRFAGNELCIVYSEKSRMGNKINAKNWYTLLLEKEVAFGRADPNADPCGYRTVLMLQLAEKYYKKAGLSKNILSKDQNLIRPKEVDLLALLESGNIDYIFLYKSVAIQHNLKYVVLPDEINLKSLAFADEYAAASTEINGDKPGVKTTVRGEPMVYGVTVLNNAPNKEAAMAFVRFLLQKDKGMEIMEKNGQPSVVPSVSLQYDKIPEVLKPYVKKK